MLLPRAVPSAHNRLDTKANHMVWLTGSIVQQRFELAKQFDNDQGTQAADELFKDNQGIKDRVTYPRLAEFKRDWDTISPALRDALENATDEKLDSHFEMPKMNWSFYDMVVFNIYREANIIGQLALWRRLLGYEAMKYD